MSPLGDVELVRDAAVLVFAGLFGAIEDADLKVSVGPEADLFRGAIGGTEVEVEIFGT